MATGGLVILIPHMSDGGRELQIAGLCQEMIDRLDVKGGALHPRKQDLGSSAPKLLSFWRNHFSVVVEEKVRFTVYPDPELLKCVLNDMVEEVGVNLWLHSWGSRAITDGDTVKGIVFESKAGRQAILGKVTIDATGDGDIFASSGAEFDAKIDPQLRNSHLAVVFLLGNVDVKRFNEYKEAEQPRFGELMQELMKSVGFRLWPMSSWRNDVVWVNNWVPGLSALDVKDLTWTEVNVRKAMLRTYELLKKNVPGFENCFIMETASQIGTRGSRRLVGEYVVTKGDMHSGTNYHDTIAVFPNLDHNQSAEYPNVQIPYRCLIPRRIEGLLVAGRCFSSDPVVNDNFNLIPHCIAMGQAAGTAAALAVKDGVSPRKVDYRALRRHLTEQGVPYL